MAVVAWDDRGMTVVRQELGTRIGEKPEFHF